MFGISTFYNLIIIKNSEVHVMLFIIYIVQALVKSFRIKILTIQRGEVTCYR